MKKYIVRFEGFAYVEALNKDEVSELYQCNETIYEEKEIVSIEEIIDFEVCI